MGQDKVLASDRPTFEGFLDLVEDGWVHGWAYDPAHPSQRVEVAIVVDGERVVSGRADRYRADLDRLGKGDGHCAFQFEVPQRFRDGVSRTLRVVYRDNGADLSGSPRSVEIGSCSVATRLSEYTRGVGYRSRFGGLWTDLDSAAELVDGKRALGWISEEESELLRTWVRDGFVVIPRAISHELIDALDLEVEQIWSGSSPHRCLVEFWEGGVRTEKPAGPAFKDKAVKLLDLHSVSDIARQLIFSKRIERFLTLLFERPALATQTLYFRWGSRQEMHQDSAFVKMSSPLQFAASWIALEDISPDTGELEYYVGSHRLEDYLFEGASKWMPANSGEYRSYVDSLHKRSSERGFKRERFLAKKGDVLLWSADLAHGGSSYIDRGITRKSLVTHYCPVSCNPIYGLTAPSIPRYRFSDGAYYTAAMRG